MKTVQEVNSILKKTLSHQSKSISGTSINNCIITNDKQHVVYSYFDAFQKENKIELELVSIKINTENDEVEAFRAPLEFQSYFRISAKETDQVQVHVQASPNNNQAYIVEIKMKGKDHDSKKSKFFMFQCTYQAILSKEPLLMVEIMAHKTINRIHWHPEYNSLFVALTADSFVIFSADESYAQIETIQFKSLQIKQKILDFCFWGNTNTQKTEERYFISALGQTKTYILYIQSQQLEKISQTNERPLNLAYENDPLQLISLYQTLDSQKKTSWQRIKLIKTIYNRRQISLVLKSSYIYKNDKKQSILEIYEISADNKADNKWHYSQRIIVSVESEWSQASISQFEFPIDDLMDASVLYYYDGKVNRLNLSKFLNSITSQHNKHAKIYPPTEQDNELLLNIGKDSAKFIFFENGGLTLLRSSKEGNNYDFARISPEMLELELGEKSIALKVKKLIETMEKQIGKNQESTETSFIDKQEFVPLSEQASEAEIQKFVNETQKFMKKSEEYLRNQKAALNNLYDEIKKSSGKLEAKYSKKERVNALLKRIERNGAQIERLLSNDAGQMGYFDEKINEVQGMVEFVINKPLELEKDAREMFAADIETHIKKADEIEEMIRQAEANLDGKF